MFVTTVVAILCLAAGQDPAAPRILLDQSPRAVEYQINRLTNDELVRVERKPGDPRYRPIYVALLTRKGLARQVRDEAVAALAGFDKTSQTQVLMTALGQLPADDGQTADKLLAMLFGQPAGTLRDQRDILTRAIDSAAQPFVLRGAYGGLIIVDGRPDAAWQLAVNHTGHLLELLRAVPAVPSDDSARQVRELLFAPIAALLSETKDPALRAAGLTALSATRRDAATFKILAQEVTASPAGSDAATKAAAVASLLSLPETVWPPAELEPLARAIVALVRETAASQRTEARIVQAVQLGEQLAGALPDSSKLAIRRELRALSVRVIRVETRPEQMLFDVNWFVVEAGKPVQVSLVNPDAMPHNFVLVKPETLTEIATAATAMLMPTDPDAKPFVPDSPAVLQATKLLTEGETAQLSFTAPSAPGEYPFLCSFPGHWVRMYGIMLVVENLEAWEANPTTPVDPITKKPFASQRK